MTTSTNELPPKGWRNGAGASRPRHPAPARQFLDRDPYVTPAVAISLPPIVRSISNNGYDPGLPLGFVLLGRALAIRGLAPWQSLPVEGHPHQLVERRVHQAA